MLPVSWRDKSCCLSRVVCHKTQNPMPVLDRTPCLARPTLRCRTASRFQIVALISYERSQDAESNARGSPCLRRFITQHRNQCPYYIVPDSVVRSRATLYYGQLILHEIRATNCYGRWVLCLVMSCMRQDERLPTDCGLCVF